MKLERSTERKYSMQEMSTTTKTTTKWKFKFTKWFMLLLELQGFYSGSKNFFDIFKWSQCYF